MIETDDDPFASVLAADDVARNGLRDGARIGEREIVGNDAAPAVCTELYRRHGKSV